MYFNSRISFFSVLFALFYILFDNVYRRSNRALSMRDRVDSSTHVASSDSDEEEKEEEETPVDEEEMSTAGVVNSSFSSSSLNSSGLLLVSSMAINTSDNAVHASFLRIISTAA